MLKGCSVGKVDKGDKNWTNNKLSLQADDIFVMLGAVALCPVWKVALEEVEEKEEEDEENGKEKEERWRRQTKQGT